MFNFKEDYESTKKRFDAFWEREITDRAPVSLPVPKKDVKPTLEKKYNSYEQKWLDIDFRVEQEYRRMQNTDYLGDSLPIVWPNMGPEIFSAWCGCGYGYGESTTWSEPCIHDWTRDMDKAVFSMEHPLFKKTVEFTEKLLVRNNNEYIVGLTDFHPGGDHLAALRDPQNLAFDMLENVELINKKLVSSHKEFFEAYDFFYNILKKYNMPITTWANVICTEGKFYIPSNDFSCMISMNMFNDVFLEGIAEECRFYNRSLYHLDGPGALQHLDSLLEIPELDAVQWVPGAGNEGYHKWVEVYKKIQDKGKGIQLWVDIKELPMVFETLKPSGVWFSSIYGVDDKETAQEVIRQVEQWK